MDCNELGINVIVIDWTQI